jgi:hypothetical protein
MTSAEYLQRLHELLDGELPAEAEEGLFYALAADAELRAALRQLILVQRALVREQPSIPAQLEQQLFQRLGFAEQGIRQRWQTGAIAIGSALLGFALGALLFLRTPEPSASSSPQPSPAVLEMALPMRAPAALPALRMPIAPPSTAPQPSLSEPPAAVVQPVPPQEPPIATFTPPQPSPTEASPATLPESIQLPASPGLPLRVGIRFLGLWQQSSPEATLPMQSSGVRNLCLSVEQPLSTAHAIALEAGSEDFPQVFSSERTGLQYRQRPTLLWVGLAHHWEPSGGGIRCALPAYPPRRHGCRSRWESLGGKRNPARGALSAPHRAGGHAPAVPLRRAVVQHTETGISYGMAFSR